MIAPVRRLRVVHLTDSGSRLGGGIFEAVRGLATALAADGIEVIALVARDRWTEVDRASWGAVELIDVPLRGMLDRVTGRPIAAALSRAAPDIVHLHGIWGVASRGLAAWHRNGIPYVVAPHGMVDRWALARSGARKRLSALLWERRLFERAAAIHVLNDEEARAVEQFAQGSRVRIVTNGVVIPGVDRARASVPRNLLFVGRLHPKKGLEPLLRGWAAVASPLRGRWRLRIAGWDQVGHAVQLVRLATDLGITGDVDFVGAVHGTEKDAAFRSASAFILPSFSEGLPIAVLEAWSYGLPVFMTSACNLPAGFAAGAAFSIDANPVAIAATLTTMLDRNDALARAGAAGRELVERAHGWPVISREMQALYRDAMSSVAVGRTAR